MPGVIGGAAPRLRGRVAGVIMEPAMMNINIIPPVEGYLKRGAVVIGEQKFGVDCDSPAMQAVYELAQAHGVARRGGIRSGMTPSDSGRHVFAAELATCWLPRWWRNAGCGRSMGLLEPWLKISAWSRSTGSRRSS